jgi:predicted acyl esterase
MHMRHLAAAAVLALAALPATAFAKDPGAAYPDADWTEVSITEADGTVLHADVLRDKTVPLDAAHRQPVVMSIGPYFNRSGQTGPTDAAYDPVGPSGPSSRFADFVEGSGLLGKGYTFMMVDLRGFGGSTGCEDWGGPGEQSDVVESIKWAAAQPWSTGLVGTYGKSYDALTGLAAAAHRPAGLNAVVAQEPVYDDYRYLYGDGMRRANFAGTPGIYTVQAATPGGLADDPMYSLNSFNDVDLSNGKPVCKPATLAEQAGNDDHYSDYWRSRDYIPQVKGSDVPLFLTQGMTEDNTVADGLAQFLTNHTGPERGWFGPWVHVRGNERTTSSPISPLKMGREGWFDEVLRFYGRYLKGETPAVVDPNFAVQTNDGKWRAEDQWPPADAKPYSSALAAGSYVDDGSSTKTGAGASATKGVWTFSPALADAAHMVGSGHVTLDVRSDVPHGNLVVDVYDLAPSGANWAGPLITRQAHLIYANGRVDLDLWSADWKLAKGHRIGVRVTDTNTDWWGDSLDTQQAIDVFGGTVTLPFLTYKRTQTLPVATNKPGVQLSSYLADKVTVPGATVTDAPGFALPPAQVDPPA